jgi:hypothetical protein
MTITPWSCLIGLRAECIVGHTINLGASKHIVVIKELHALAMDRTRSVMLGTMSFVGSIGIMLFGEG